LAKGSRPSSPPAGARGSYSSEISCKEATQLNTAEQSRNQFPRSSPTAGNCLPFCATFAPVAGRATGALPSSSVVAGEQLCKQKVDVAFVYTLPTNLRELKSRRISVDRWVLALPGAHPLVTSKRVRLRDLKGEPFVWFPRAVAPLLYDRVLSACPVAMLFIAHERKISFECCRPMFRNRYRQFEFISPPTSLRFEAFSGEVRKLHACRGDAHGPSAPENAQMVSRRASLRFSLCGRVIRCRCPLLANATFGQGQPISRAIQRSSRASDGRKALA
jgi:hypothetical protein